MIRIITLLAFVLLMACHPENTTPTMPVTNGVFDPANSSLLKQGMLTGVGHTASGTVKIYESNGKKVILFDPYSSQEGPDLKVYLSKDSNASEYIRVGNLKSTMGSQSYDVPGNPDINQYKYVHIWCEKYTVVFAIAEMKYI